MMYNISYIIKHKCFNLRPSNKKFNHTPIQNGRI